MSELEFSLKKNNIFPAPGFLLFPPPVHTPSNTNYPLELKSADLNIKQNTIAHHTDEFHVTKLVKNGHLAVRRGQNFLIDVTFYREYDSANDDLTLSFEIGKTKITKEHC